MAQRRWKTPRIRTGRVMGLKTNNSGDCTGTPPPHPHIYISDKTGRDAVIGRHATWHTRLCLQLRRTYSKQCVLACAFAHTAYHNKGLWALHISCHSPAFRFYPIHYSTCHQFSLDHCPPCPPSCPPRWRTCTRACITLPAGSNECGPTVQRALMNRLNRPCVCAAKEIQFHTGVRAFANGFATPLVLNN